MGFINALNRTKRFEQICAANKLSLNFKWNESGFQVFESIFVKREYADYFPFYENATIIDIGAHYGYFSLFAAVNTDDAARIFSFEPDSVNFQKLKQNVLDCKTNKIYAQQCAVSARTGSIDLFKGSDINHSIIQEHSLLENSSEKETVQSISLDDLIVKNTISHVDFLKMDCEGAEYEILFNTSGETLTKIKTISIEFHDLKSSSQNANTLIAHMRNFGFQVVKFMYEPSNYGLNYGKLIFTKA